MPVTAFASGTQTATVTTEHSLSGVNVAGSYKLVVDLNAMVAGDGLELRIYQTVLTGGTNRKAIVYSFYGAQDADTLIFQSDVYDNDLTDSNSLKFTLKQTTGTSRNFAWKVLSLKTEPTNFNLLSIDANGRVDVIKVAGTTQTARDIGASVLLSSGTGAGQISLSSGAVLLQATQTGVTIPTVTTVTNQLTAAQVATGVWQDATAGDFTTASSIGKALYVANIAPGGAGGHFIAGTNAATTINGTAASGATPATPALTLTGGAASTSGGGVSASAILATGGAGAASTNGAAAGVKFIGGGTNTVASSASGLIVTGTSTGDGLEANSGAGATGDGIHASALSTNGNGIELVKTGTGLALKGATTDLTLAKTTNITGLNDIAATAIVSSGAITTSSGAVTTVTTATNLTNAPTAGDLTATMKTSVKTQITDALNVDTYAEPTGVPASTTTLVGKIGRIYQALRNKVTVTGSSKGFFDDANAALWSKALADDGTTYTESKGA